MSSNLSFLYEHSQKELDETYQEIKQLTEKCKSVEQKVDDLNKIMMKHFAYKTNKEEKTEKVTVP